jgi:hypothetical protein
MILVYKTYQSGGTPFTNRVCRLRTIHHRHGPRLSRERFPTATAAALGAAWRRSYHPPSLVGKTIESRLHHGGYRCC